MRNLLCSIFCKKTSILAIALITAICIGGCSGGLSKEEKALVGEWKLTDMQAKGESYMSFIGEAEGTLTLLEDKTGEITMKMSGEENSTTFDWEAEEDGSITYIDENEKEGYITLYEEKIYFDSDGFNLVFERK